MAINMRIVGHIHTFNDEDVIDRSLQALLDQTYPVEKILLVDNGSTDNTLQRPFPEKVIVIRQPQNTGTSGAVVAGFQYALAKHFDWIWILDADSVPCADALEKLVKLYQRFPPGLQKQVWLLSSLPLDIATWGITSPVALQSLGGPENGAAQPRHGIIFNSRGYSRAEPVTGEEFYECNASIWSGSLFKLKTVQEIGLPSEDYVLDYGEYAYGYHGMRCGYRMFMHQSSIIKHNIRGSGALAFSTYALGTLSLNMIELAPIRCYYVTRNMLYFWLYVYRSRTIYTLSPRVFKICVLTLNFLFRPISHWPQLMACLRGIWDGLNKNIHHRY